ncbi:MAG: FkbM family methyltransferase [Bacteroidota bacterium]
MVDVLRKVFRASYYALYGKKGKGIKINNEDYNVSAYVSRGISKIVDETPLKLLINMSRNARIVFDVGANVGVIAIMVAKRMQPGTIIYSFEPAPLSYKYLADTARVQDGNAKIIPQNYAISSENGKLYFTNDGDSCTNHIAAQNDPNVIAIEALTLDSFCQKNKVVPEVIKVDIEGAEYWALEGMQQTLKNNNCSVLMEIHDAFLRAHNIDGKMFGRVVDAIGYKVFNTAGQQIGNDEIMQHTCVIIAKQKPAEEVFKIV